MMLTTCALWFAITIVSGSAQSAEPAPIPIGVASIDVTPDGPIRLSGFTSRTTESVGVENRLKVKALAIGADGVDGGPTVLITVDNCTIGISMTEEVAAKLKAKHGVTRDRMVICASHTHSGPVLSVTPETLFGPLPADQQDRIDKYTRKLTDALYDVAHQALEARSPGRLSWGRGKVGFAGNRRILKDGRWAGFGLNPNGPVDHSLPILKVEDPDGKIRAIVFGYACHGTTLYGDFNKIGGDWIGYACEAIEEKIPGSVALAVMGCGADSGPQPSGKLEYAKQHGAEVAREVDRLMKTPLKPLTGRILAGFRAIDLPLEAAPSREDIAARLDRPGSEGFLARKLIGQLDRGEPLARTISYPIHTWRFDGDLAMVFLGGEVVLDYSLRLKWEIDAERLWVSSYTDDVSCYIPSRRVLSEGGYEPDGSMALLGHPARFAPEVEDLIVRTVHDLLPAPFDGPDQP